MILLKSISKGGGVDNTPPPKGDLRSQNRYCILNRDVVKGLTRALGGVPVPVLKHFRNFGKCDEIPN